MSSSEAFCSFDPQSARLDEFYHEHLSNKEEFHNLWVRIICDHIQHVGGLCNIDYSKELLMSAADAKEKYERYCEDHLRLQKNKKRKRFEEEVSEIRMKKQKVEEDIKDLLKSADKNAEEAEKRGKLYFL
ncbi:hypothetical protein WMY93_022881 [Mugilogobius chulae]|uniref:Uncharacterized protein n=1 Tax=Mugilogobius chulae TaxID=88201 RepID=A0AAW0ND88_9GOBI